ncbi:hypothetical protein Q3C72_09275 [Enterococcus faecium]|nr:hypothetical protein [Enterococcus faecium]
MKKAVIICALGIGFVGGNAMSSEVEANSVHGEIYYKSLKPGEIHFDAKGNIIKSNLPVDREISRTAINHSSGRWVYYSDTTCTRKTGHSNHYSRVYNHHGAKAKVGNSIRSANATKGVWAYASATGNRTDTFSCWYNPIGWY